MMKKRVDRIAKNILKDYPNHSQIYDYDCGASAVKTILAYYGNDADYEALMKELDTRPDEGTTMKSIISFLKKEKFEIKAGKMTLDVLKSYVDKDYPVIVVLQAWAEKRMKIEEWKKDWADGHYVVAIGYGDGKIYFEDPSSINKTYIPEKEFEARWHDKDGKITYDHYGIVVIGRRDKLRAREIIYME